MERVVDAYARSLIFWMDLSWHPQQCHARVCSDMAGAAWLQEDGKEAAGNKACKVELRMEMVEQRNRSHDDE